MENILFITIFFIIFRISNCLNKQPHIIVIMADDMGRNDVSYYGSNQIPTPNIDCLAFNGIIMNKFYTQSTCTPSRSAFLTGTYPIRTGLQGVPISIGENRSLASDYPTIAELLRSLNYQTHLIGKWHLGAAYQKNTPIRRGFANYFGYWWGWIGYFNYMTANMLDSLNISSGFDLHENSNTASRDYIGRYATDLFTEKALDVIDQHDVQRPLFMMVSHLAAHTGDNGVELGVPDLDEVNDRFDYIKNPRRRLYAEVVRQFDLSVGRIVKRLQERHLLENSIILVFSDNGAPSVNEYSNSGSNWPYRGQKYSLHEGGIRPYAAIYSPLLKTHSYINNELIHLSDWLPTFLRLANENQSNYIFDGINQWDMLSENKSTKRHEILLNIDDDELYSGIIGYNGRYKLLNGTYRNGISDDYYGESGRDLNINQSYNYTAILQSQVGVALDNMGIQLADPKKMADLREAAINDCRPNEPIEICHELCLYDLWADPCETRNLIGQQPEIVDFLKQRLVYYRNEMRKSILRKPDPLSDPARYQGTWCTWLDDKFCPKS